MAIMFCCGPLKTTRWEFSDLAQNRIVLASKISAMDLWDDTYIAERDDGDLQIFALGPVIKPLAQASLPAASMDAVRTAALSPDRDGWRFSRLREERYGTLTMAAGCITSAVFAAHTSPTMEPCTRIFQST